MLFDSILALGAADINVVIARGKIDAGSVPQSDVAAASANILERKRSERRVLVAGAL
jgi:hypothetical protein